VLCAVPFVGLPAFYESFLYLLLSAIVLATSWNLLSGYSGYFSFGHGAFFGVGVYTTAALTGKLGWNFLWTLPLAALVATVLGVALGAVVFRVRALRGELFALLTLAITFVMSTIALNAVDGGPGIMVNADLPKIAPTASGVLYLLMLAAAALTLWTAHAMFHSRFGTGLFAIHDDEDVAEVMGVPTYRFKLAAFAISCALAGLAGGIHAVFVSYVTVAETFSIALAVNVVLMSALGGTRHWLGPAVGAVAITMLLYAFTSGQAAVIGRALTGLILIVVIVVMPEGILGQILKRFRRKEAPMRPVVEGLVSPNTRKESAEPLLVVKGAAKAFKGVQALAGVDLEVRRGEILGLVGPNGSGKSTLINMISGHFPLTAGSIVLDGETISALEPHEVARKGVARTYQIPRLFDHMTVLENVRLCATFGRAGDGLEDDTAAQARHWLVFTGLADKADQLPGMLNLHERKFVEFARALAARPKLLLLDEVLCGLTPSEVDQAIDLIRRIRAGGTTIVFVEHVMRAVVALADRVAVLDQGRLLALGAPHETMQNPEVIGVYLGVAHAA
jgi:branched-chain amino acid transport system permease protein